MFHEYIPIFMMIAAGVAFGIIMVKLNEWLGPKRPTEEKLTTYESGMEPVRTARERFSVKFYMVAMLFIVFDIEIVFLYPWAVAFTELPLAAHGAMFLFLIILVIGFYYEWRKGAMEWD